MPGGNPTVKKSLLNLASFLARKRWPLDQWLLTKNITTLEALEALVSGGEWHISPDLHQKITELLKPVSVSAGTTIIPPAPVPVVETVVEAVSEPVVVIPEPQPVAVEEPVVAPEPVVEETPKAETLPPPAPVAVEQEPVVVVPPVVEEEIPSFTFNQMSSRERKRNR